MKKHLPLLLPLCAIAILALVMLIKPSPSQPNLSSNPPGAAGIPAKETQDLTVGDLEMKMKLVATLAPQSKGPNVAEQDLKDMRQNVNMTTLNVAPPFPAQFFLNFTVSPFEALHETTTGAALHIIVMVDKQAAGQFDAIFGGDKGYAPQEFAIDVLAGRNAPPPSVLVYAEAKAVLMKPGEAPDKALNGEEAGHLMSNPVRINFGTPEAKP